MGISALPNIKIYYKAIIIKQEQENGAMKQDTTEINPSVDDNLTYYKSHIFSMGKIMHYLVIATNILDMYLE